MPPEPDKTTIIPSELGKLLATPQLARPTIVTPQIIEEGKEVVRPDVLQAVVQLAHLGQLVKIRKSVEKQDFQGIEDPRNSVSATDHQQYIDLINGHPFQPWVSAFFENNVGAGAHDVFIAINDPTRPFRLVPGATRTIDHAYGDKKIEIIFYQCNPGETAIFDVVGQY